MDDKTVEQLEFHKQTVASDDNSPLHLIREKEMEISGTVLAAKRQADEIVAKARHDAGEIIAQAHESVSARAGAREAEIKADIEREMAAVRADSEREVSELAATIAGKQKSAIDYIVEQVTSAS